MIGLGFGLTLRKCRNWCQQLQERGFRVYMTLMTNARPVRFSFGKNAYNIIYSFAKM